MIKIHEVLVLPFIIGNQLICIILKEGRLAIGRLNTPPVNLLPIGGIVYQCFFHQLLAPTSLYRDRQVNDPIRPEDLCPIPVGLPYVVFMAIDDDRIGICQEGKVSYAR